MLRRLNHVVHAFLQAPLRAPSMISFSPQTSPQLSPVLPLNGKSRTTSPIRNIRIPRRLFSARTLLPFIFLFFTFLSLFRPRSGPPKHAVSSLLAPTDGLLPAQEPIMANITVAAFSDNGYSGSTDMDQILLPPTYEQYRVSERSYSWRTAQSQPGTKYLYFANHAWGAGFGNILQELLLNSVLAQSSGRAMVFDDYTWSRDTSKEYSEYGGHLIPSRVALTSMIAGPIVGSQNPAGVGAPTFIHRSVYDVICRGRKMMVPTSQIKASMDAWVDGKTLFDTWSVYLKGLDYDCVEIMVDTEAIFDIWLFGTYRLHSLIDYYLTSTVVQFFSFSPLLHDAFNTNINLFLPASLSSSLINFNFVGDWCRSIKAGLSVLVTPFSKITSSHGSELSASAYVTGSTTSNLADPPPSPAPWNTTSSLPSLLALHIRRGDFQDHCKHLATWSSNFTGMNTLLTSDYSAQTGLQHPDEFVPPPGAGWGENTPENFAIYERRCFPSIQQIVEKVYEIRTSYESRHTAGPSSYMGSLLGGWGNSAADADMLSRPSKKLSKIYVMTNAPAPWIEELKDAIQVDSDDLLEITSSRDVALTHEQKYVAHALDMYVGSRAEVFVGNGFSSLTANIVLLRIARRLNALDTRFW